MNRVYKIDAKIITLPEQGNTAMRIRVGKLTDRFRDIFLAPEQHVSRSEFKRLMLTGFMSVIIMAVAVIYTFIDLLNEVFYSIPAYLVLLLAALAALVFLRQGKYKAAKVLLIITTNLVVFWSALMDPFETGVFMFFIPVGISSFAVFGSEEIYNAMTLSVLTTSFFLIAYFTDFQPIRVAPITEQYIQVSLLFNYFISFIVSTLAVYFLINLNKLSENDLIQKELFANQKNEELQKVNVELDRFVYSVSHDLRSPLSSILGLINLAKISKDREEIDEILTMIQSRVHAQDNFIKEIIDYARNARTETVAEPVKLRDIVNEVISSLRYIENADRISFMITISENTILYSDHIRLTVILNNVIGNAIKYHDLNKADPYIMIEFDDATSTLIIRDNGAGIKREHQDKIFDMFYRGSEKSKGSGLGLFITKETVNKLGGRINLKSTYGEGSTFEIYIPSVTPHLATT